MCWEQARVLKWIRSSGTPLSTLRVIADWLKQRTPATTKLRKQTRVVRFRWVEHTWSGPEAQHSLPNASMTSLGACTSSISTPSPDSGLASLPLGWMNVMSKPEAPLRMPPGVKRTPLPCSHLTAAGRSSIQSPMWFSCGSCTFGLLEASMGCTSRGKFGGHCQIIVLRACVTGVLLRHQPVRSPAWCPPRQPEGPSPDAAHPRLRFPSPSGTCWLFQGRGCSPRSWRVSLQSRSPAQQIEPRYKILTPTTQQQWLTHPCWDRRRQFAGCRGLWRAGPPPQPLRTNAAARRGAEAQQEDLWGARTWWQLQAEQCCVCTSMGTLTLRMANRFTVLRD